MSDKESELTEDQLKEQKLEAARKKYEQLKNKKGKKKKAKKEKKEDDKEDSKEPTAEPEEEDDAVGTKNDEELDNKPDTEEVAKDDKIEDQTNNEDKEAAQSEEAKPEATEEIKEEVKDDQQVKSEEIKEEVKEDVQSSDVAKPTQSIEDKLTEKLGDLELEENEDKEESIAAGVVAREKSPADDLFPDEGPSFMDSINQAQSNEALVEVQKENSTLKAELERVKKENKDLKLIKMDHLDQIETLEARVTDLESKLSKAKVDSSKPAVPTHLGSVYDQDDTFSLSPTPSAQQSFPTTFSQFKPHHNNDSQLSLGEIKAKLNKWKGWNIDMTNWRSVGSGPIVEL